MIKSEVLTRGEFEERMSDYRIIRKFLYVLYKGRWQEVNFIRRNNSNLYIFYGSENNVLMSECIVKVCYPIGIE